MRLVSAVLGLLVAIGIPLWFLYVIITNLGQVGMAMYLLTAVAVSIVYYLLIPPLVLELKDGWAEVYRG